MYKYSVCIISLFASELLLSNIKVVNGLTCSQMGGSIAECSNHPCNCHVEDEFCDQCHSNGCNQCDDGYFKIGYNYPCTSCQHFFTGCSFCQDFHGCGQCDNGYDLVQDTTCGIFYCQKGAAITQFENALTNMVDSDPSVDPSYIEQYASYASKFNKLNRYPTDGSDGYSELKFRYNNYIDSDNYIINLQSSIAGLIPEITSSNDLPTYDHTEYSDYDDNEREELLHNSDYNPASAPTEPIIPIPITRRLLGGPISYVTGPSTKGSSYTDYRSSCQSIQNQGGCGSCWAFAATSSFECNYVMNGGNSLKFSEQYALSCSGAGTCSGGWTHNVLTYYEDYGNCLTSDYGPYTANNDACVASTNCAGKTIKADGVRRITPETDFKGAVNYISYNQVAMIFHMAVVPSFYYVSSGSPEYWSCFNEGVIGYHAMTIVGQKTKYVSGIGNVDYFLVRNSWGTGWGDNGYFWLSEYTKDTCNVYGYAWNYWDHPIVVPTPRPTLPPRVCNRFGSNKCSPLNSRDHCTCSQNPHCSICHENAQCDQCENGYFQIDYDFPCEKCQDVFGYSCLFCQDFNGCGQCKDGCTRVYNDKCGLWECECYGKY
jgi:hypothetical protein